MKIQSLATRVQAPTAPVLTSVTDGAAYRAWQERWKEHRGPMWQWSTSPAAMAVEAVQALTQDLEASQGQGTTHTLMRLLVAMSMDLPAGQRDLELTIPALDADGHTCARAKIAWTMTPSQPQDPNAATVNMTLVPEDEIDRTRLKEMGVLGTTGEVPTPEAMALLNEAAERELDSTPVPTWAPNALRDALIDCERRWPDLSSPLQAMPVVAGWVLWQRAHAMNASESGLVLRGITFGRAPDQVPLDAKLSVVRETVEPAHTPRRPAMR